PPDRRELGRAGAEGPDGTDRPRRSGHRRRAPSRPPRASPRALAALRRPHRASPRGRVSHRGGAGVRIVRGKPELREALAEPRRHAKRIGLVPTMGYFHEGHLSLMRAARQECDLVVVSLFVNPTQFGGGEDLDSYPRDEQRDVELAEGEGVDLLWI